MQMSVRSISNTVTQVEGGRCHTGTHLLSWCSAGTVDADGTGGSGGVRIWHKDLMCKSGMKARKLVFCSKQENQSDTERKVIKARGLSPHIERTQRRAAAILQRYHQSRISNASVGRGSDVNEKPRAHVFVRTAVNFSATYDTWKAGKRVP